MTKEEAKRIAQGLMTDFKCESETMVEFCKVIIKALEQEPCGDMVSRGVFEQVMWERDVAISQLKELGYELGQKVEPQESEE